MKDMICNQHALTGKEWRYGLRGSDATGCGWIATYNALRLMGCYAPPEELIRYYTCQLPLIHGNLGTTLPTPAIFFRQQGFGVRVSLRPGEFDALAGDADACILFYRWRQGVRLGAHFVALHSTGMGFEGYNTYRNSTGADSYGASLRDFLKRKGYFGAVLIALNRK